MHSSFAWRCVDDLIGTGFDRAATVLINEAHNGLTRSMRTRRIGLDVVDAAHARGVRRMALEALDWGLVLRRTSPAEAARRTGYLAQRDMRALIDSALDRGWTLYGYEDAIESVGAEDRTGLDATNAREAAHAAHLALLVSDGDPMLVWCGNGHLLDVALHGWRPMGGRLRHDHGLLTFSIDQTRTVQWPSGADWDPTPYTPALRAHGGVAGFLADDAPPTFPAEGADAYLVALDNALT